MKQWLTAHQRIIISLLIAIFVWSVWLSAFGSFAQAAQSKSNWMDPNLVIGQHEEVNTDLPETLAFAGNIDCRSKSFRTRPPIPPLQSGETFRACAVATPHGQTAPGGFTDVFKADAKLFSSNGGTVSFYPVPGDDGGVVLESTPKGTKLHYHGSGVLSARKEFNLATRELKVFLGNNPTWTLKDGSGKPLYVQPDSLSFSSNGQWMVVDSPFLAMLIVELKSGKVTPFSSPYSYHLGLSVTPHTAVSDDGRSVVIASDSGDFKIFDTTSCAPTPISISGPVDCQSARHDGLLRSMVAGYRRVYQPRFLNDHRLSIYVSYKSGVAVPKLAKLRLGSAGEVLEQQAYLALGDSFASGEGAYDYFPETSTLENNCHLSRNSYPYLVGRQLGLDSFDSVACSGAKIQDVTTYVQKREIPSPNSMGRMLPGYKKQIQYVRDHNPQVITIGVGGNDIGFGDIIKRCVGSLVPSTCYESYEDRLEMVRLVNEQFDKLVAAYSDVKKSANNTAKIYVLGYPSLASQTGKCALNVQLSTPEIIFANQLIDYINYVVEQSALKAGVAYVDVSRAFVGHRMCETDSAQVAMNGITAGDDKFGILGSESYHPNSLGHELYKRKILEQTVGFSRTMPIANPSLQEPDEDLSLPLLLAERNGRQVNKLIVDSNLVADTLLAGKSTIISAGRGDYFLQPNKSYDVELHSEGIRLGSFKTNELGHLEAEITIPKDVPSGFHALHIYGQDLVENSIDINQTVYVGAQEDYLPRQEPNNTSKNEGGDMWKANQSEVKVIVITTGLQLATMALYALGQDRYSGLDSVALLILAGATLIVLMAVNILLIIKLIRRFYNRG